MINLTPLINAPTAVQLHLLAVAIAIIGTIIIAVAQKGSRLHKTTGRIFVFGMATAAISSFWIMELNNGSPSFIHLISAATLIGLFRAVQAARRGDIATHKRAMILTVVGGLVIAGGFAALNPHRLIGQMLFG